MIESGDLIDPVLNIPVYSLYGKTRIPAKDMLDPIDILVVDLFLLHRPNEVARESRIVPVLAILETQHDFFCPYFLQNVVRDIHQYCHLKSVRKIESQ